ncbi:MAG: glutamyl-Q tRNA(Asp) synthetase [Xanthomonadales bacterium PRO7]|nr:glutamyl-Q tRNA(Asp) synthetase [Xanthomonadales bacterium PRO7]
MTYRGRFAPSPTGQLHFGSLVAALGSWLRARSQNGAWIVRMEDLDPPREVPGAAADILATLAAFGMESDEPVMLQSRRENAYATAFARLDAAGHVFPCWCSRVDLEPFGGIHRTCFAPPDPARAPAWRLRDDAGDFVIRRVEGWYAYHLAVVVDDAEQGITEVVRGADLLDSTPRQIRLQQLLGLPTPAYLHLPLALDPEGRKLSKQDRARPVDRADPAPALRAALRFLGQHVVGANDVATLLSNAVTGFDLAALQTVTKTGACTIGPDSA